MIRPWVEVSNSQYEEVWRPREKTGKPVSKIIREAVSRFVTKKDYFISIGTSHLPKATREDYRRVAAYFPGGTWDLLKKVCEPVGRSNGGFIREDVGEYFRKSSQMEE